MSPPSRALARRYARALLDVAAEEGKDAAGRLKVELRALAAILEAHPGLRQASEDPRVRPESRRRVLGAIAETMGLSPLARKLLDVLADRDRVLLLPALAETYAEQMNARHGIVAAEATAAVGLSPQQERALVAALAGTAGRAVELTSRVDPRVLGGLRVKVGGRAYDGTVRGRLARLRRILAGAR